VAEASLVRLSHHVTTTAKAQSLRLNWRVFVRAECGEYEPGASLQKRIVGRVVPEDRDKIGARVGAQAMAHRFSIHAVRWRASGFCAVRLQLPAPKPLVDKCELDAERSHPEETLYGPSPSIDMAHSIKCDWLSTFVRRCSKSTQRRHVKFIHIGQIAQA
jgi:hypothetical protein